MSISPPDLSSSHAALASGTRGEADAQLALRAHGDVHPKPRIALERFSGHLFCPDFGLYLPALEGAEEAVLSSGAVVNCFLAMRRQDSGGSTVDKMHEEFDALALAWERTGVVGVMLLDGRVWTPRRVAALHAQAAVCASVVCTLSDVREGLLLPRVQACVDRHRGMRPGDSPADRSPTPVAAGIAYRAARQQARTPQ